VFAWHHLYVKLDAGNKETGPSPKQTGTAVEGERQMLNTHDSNGGEDEGSCHGPEELILSFSITRKGGDRGTKSSAAQGDRVSGDANGCF
jgi:hypothetical protein